MKILIANFNQFSSAISKLLIFLGGRHDTRLQSTLNLDIFLRLSHFLKSYLNRLATGEPTDTFSFSGHNNNLVPFNLW